VIDWAALFAPSDAIPKSSVDADNDTAGWAVAVRFP
jgi:hypothetical protein